MILIEDEEDPYLMGQISKPGFKYLELKGSNHLLLGEWTFLSIPHFVKWELY